MGGRRILEGSSCGLSRETDEKPNSKALAPLRHIWMKRVMLGDPPLPAGGPFGERNRELVIRWPGRTTSLAGERGGWSGENDPLEPSLWGPVMRGWSTDGPGLGPRRPPALTGPGVQQGAPGAKESSGHAGEGHLRAVVHQPTRLLEAGPWSASCRGWGREVSAPVTRANRRPRPQHPLPSAEPDLPGGSALRRLLTPGRGGPSGEREGRRVEEIHSVV